MDELKAAVKQQMQLQAFQQAEEAYHEALVNQAVANAKVDIPQEWWNSALTKSWKK